MRKTIYMIALGVAVGSLGLSAVGCSKKEETTPIIEESTENPNHTPYVESEPMENPPELEDRPYFEDYSSLDEIIEQEAKEELANKIGDKASPSEASLSGDTGAEPEYVVDNTTGERVEKKKSVSGDTTISIKQVDSFTEYDALNDTDRVGDILRLDDYDSIELGYKFKEAGATYEVKGDRIEFSYPDGRAATYVKLGSGFVSANVLSKGYFKQVVGSVFGVDAGSCIYTAGMSSDSGPICVGTLVSPDLTESYELYRGSNGVYLAKFKGVLPYQYEELSTNIKLYTMN